MGSLACNHGPNNGLRPLFRPLRAARSPALLNGPIGSENRGTLPLMRTLSVRQPWANLLADGTKTIELRTWATDYRGPLVICAAKAIDPWLLSTPSFWPQEFEKK